jgi:hypothetical protein
MADTTADNVKLIAPELVTFIDDNASLTTLILDDVAAQVESAIYGNKQERAQRYLAAHFLTLSKQGSEGLSSGAAGPVKREKVGDVEFEYSSNISKAFSDLSRLDETKYGRVFIDIRRGCVVGFEAVTP